MQQDEWGGGLPTTGLVKLTAVRLGKSFSEYADTTFYKYGYAINRWLCNDCRGQF